MSSRLSGAAGILEQVYGAPTYLGTITVSANAKTAATTSSAFTIPAGSRLLLQGDAAFYFSPTPSCTADGQASTAVDASATTSVLVASGAERQFCLRTAQNDVSIYATGAANVRVFSLI